MNWRLSFVVSFASFLFHALILLLGSMHLFSLFLRRVTAPTPPTIALLLSEEEPPSPTRTSRAYSSGSRPRTGIVYPLQPRQRRPDTYIDVEAAALPEPAALQQDDPLPSREVPTDLTRPAQRPARKRHRKRSSALYRPAKRSPPRGRWCIL